MMYAINSSARLDVEDGFLVLRKAYKLNNLEYDILVSDGDNFFEKRHLAILDPSLKDRIQHIFYDCICAAAQQRGCDHDIASSYFTYNKKGNPNNSCFTTLAHVGEGFHGIGHQKPQNYPAQTINDQMSDLACFLATKHRRVMGESDYFAKTAAKAATATSSNSKAAESPKKDVPTAKAAKPLSPDPAAIRAEAQKLAEKKRAAHVKEDAGKINWFLHKIQGVLPNLNPKPMQEALNKKST